MEKNSKPRAPITENNSQDQGYQAVTKVLKYIKHGIQET